MYYSLSSWAVLAILIAIIGGALTVGTAIGRWLRASSEEGHRSVGVAQGALLGLVGLLLAFGMSMAVGRYEHRRQLVVEEANAIGTAHLRAQLLQEPFRSRSLTLFATYADGAVELADQVPDSSGFSRASADLEAAARSLWQIAGEAVESDPTGTPPRLYVESLNEMFDDHAARLASLRNRVPSTVSILLVIASGVAVGVLAAYLAMLGRGVSSALLAASIIVLILFVSFDLDRPRRGLITVPDTPLAEVQAQIHEPPAASPG